MTCDNKHIFVSAVVSAPSSPRHNKNWVFVLDKHLLAQAFREICVEISLDMFLSLVSHQAILVWKVEGMELMKGISVFSEDRRNSWFSCVSNQYHSREFSLGLEKKNILFFFFFSSEDICPVVQGVIYIYVLGISSNDLSDGVGVTYWTVQ